MLSLRIVFVAQLLVMLPACVFFVATRPNVYSALMLVVLVPLGFAAMLFAAWQGVRHRSRARLALATAATPVVCLGVPFGVTELNGGPLSPRLLLGVAAVAIVAALAFVLGRAGRWRETSLARRGGFNRGLFAALFGLLVLYWLPIVGLVAGQSFVSWPGAVAERDAVLRAAGLYMLAVAVPAVGLAVFALFHAPIGWLRDPGGRALHLGQLLAALLLLASLAAGATVVFVAGVNPG